MTKAPFAFEHKKSDIVRKAFAITRLTGELLENGRKKRTILREIKKVAREFALEIDMPEALNAWDIPKHINLRDTRRKLVILQGRIAKALEALDHANEDFPSERVLVECLRGIYEI